MKACAATLCWQQQQPAGSCLAHNTTAPAACCLLHHHGSCQRGICVRRQLLLLVAYAASRVGMTLLVACQYSMALLMPLPGLIFMPAG